MHIPRPGRLRLPRRTARLRLTVLYGAAFLACGAAVLAVVAYLLYGSTANRASAGQPTSSASATEVFGSRIPVAEVRQAGGYDVVPVRVPIADVRQAGRYDIVHISAPVPVPAPAARSTQLPAPLTAAELAKLASMAQDQANYDEEEILILCAVALAIIAVAAAAIGWMIAGRVLRPISTITAAARHIAASSLHERLDLHGPDDELKELADTLDSLLARLEGSFDAERRFAANASHELRTPLTRERALLQVTLADPGATVGTWRTVSQELLASNAEQERLIEALLTLAGSEADPGQRERADLAVIAGDALAAARTGIGRRDLHVSAALETAAINGDPQLVQQLAGNLIDNAVRHNVPGGDLRITTATSDAGAVLSVANSGPVIPPSEVDRLFQPFQRLGPRPVRDGHGLGLSIVRAIASSHGAAIGARALPEGGLAVDVTFPPVGSPIADGTPNADGHRPGSDRGRRALPSPLAR